MLPSHCRTVCTPWHRQNLEDTIGIHQYGNHRPWQNALSIGIQGFTWQEPRAFSHPRKPTAPLSIHVGDGISLHSTAPDAVHKEFLPILGMISQPQRVRHTLGNTKPWPKCFHWLDGKLRYLQNGWMGNRHLTQWHFAMSARHSILLPPNWPHSTRAGQTYTKCLPMPWSRHSIPVV